MKSQLVERINKLLWTGEISKYRFVIIHRGAPKDEKVISGKNIKGLKDRFLLVETPNGEIKIPIHRIKRIERCE